MSLFRIALRSILQRGVASLLTMFSMALGVMLVVAVLSIHGVVSQSFRNNASLGYNMIAGAKGGKEQLTLNTVFYLSQPVENIPYTYYLEFLKRDERDRLLGHSLGGESQQALAETTDLLMQSGGGAFSGLATNRTVDSLGLALVPDARTEPHFPPVEVGRDGLYGPMTELAIPLCLGDYYGRFRVVGTTPALFDDLVYDIENHRKFEFAQGRNFRWRDEKNGYFEAVVGSTVAREILLTELRLRIDADLDAAKALILDNVNWSRVEKKDGAIIVALGQGSVESDSFLAMRRLQKEVDEKRRKLSASEQQALSALLLPSIVERRSFRHITVGDQFSPKHGDPGGHTHARKFTVVGILRPSGTPNDRAVFVNMEGFYLMEDHAKPLEEAKSQNADEQPKLSDKEAWEKMKAAKKKKAEIELVADPEPLPVEQREVTAILLKIPYMFAPGLENAINQGTHAQAVLPVAVIYGLFEFIVKPIEWTLLILTAMICVVSGISILVSIYNSMSERRGEIAVMRALGAGRGTVMTIILLEATLLALGGGFFGWLGGHAGTWAISPWIEERTGVQVGFGMWEPAIRILTLLGASGSAAERVTLPIELLLIPALILLAILVGIWPAISAYRTDVAKSLGK
jgi:ABC-type antimicrobial peptide transport system permease subunit